MKTRAGAARAFTLVEIMIVVVIVGVLSALAAFTIGWVKNVASESIVRNNLRQLYHAQEQFFMEHPEKTSVGAQALFRDGYISRSLRDALSSGASLSSQGWHYITTCYRDKPVQAFHGAPLRAGATPTADQRTIYYPTGEGIVHRAVPAPKN